MQRMGKTTSSATPTPLRILMVAPTSFFADYGCHVRIYEEVRALQARGHRVRICTYHNGNDVPGLDIHRSVGVPWLNRAEVGSSRHKAYLDVALFAETLRQALAFKPDIIHGHLHEGALIGGVIARLLRKPLVFDYQGSLTEEMLDHGFIRERGRRERFFRRLERFIDRLPATVIPSSGAGQQHLLKTGTPPERIALVHDGVDVRRFDPAQQNDARTRFATGTRHSTERARRRLSRAAGRLSGHVAPDRRGAPPDRASRRCVRRHCRLSRCRPVRGEGERYPSRTRPVSRRFPTNMLPQCCQSVMSRSPRRFQPPRATASCSTTWRMRLPVVATDTPTNREILGGLGHLVAPGDACALAAQSSARSSTTMKNATRSASGLSITTPGTSASVDIESVYIRALQLVRARTTE